MFKPFALVSLLVLARNLCSAASGEAQPGTKLPDMPIPRRLLVVAPHPDDASLSAGLLMRVQKAGGAVCIVELTSGDHPNPFAMAYVHRTGFRAHPDRRVNYGLYRQMEDRNALRTIGVDPCFLVCLAYADASLWGLLQRSGIHRIDAKKQVTWPPANACGDMALLAAHRTAESVANEIASALSQFRPDAIILTHPNDNHRDHAATYWLGMEAVRRAGIDIRNVPIFCPLDAYGTSLPLGLRPERWFKKPRELPSPTRWHELALSPQEVRSKIEMLAEYPSQMAWEHPTEKSYKGYLSYMFGYVAQNELYGMVDAAHARDDEHFRRKLDNGVRLARFFGAFGNVFTDLGRRLFGTGCGPTTVHNPPPGIDEWN